MPAYDLLHVQGEATQVKKRGPWPRRDEQINVAFLARLVTRDRAEDPYISQPRRDAASSARDLSAGELPERLDRDGA